VPALIPRAAPLEAEENVLLSADCHLMTGASSFPVTGRAFLTNRRLIWEVFHPGWLWCPFDIGPRFVEIPLAKVDKVSSRRSMIWMSVLKVTTSEQWYEFMRLRSRFLILWRDWERGAEVFEAKIAELRRNLSVD
jgi:hypothetical protein